MASHLAEVAIRKRVSAASDAFYDEARNLGDAAWRGETTKSQIAALENTANSATRIAEILDFIKRQTGRSRPDKRWRFERLGENLIEKVDGKLRQDARAIVEKVRDEIKAHELHEDDQSRIHILLCREFFSHLSAQYLYGSGVSRAAISRESDP
jgi:hypothetical protein